MPEIMPTDLVHYVKYVCLPIKNSYTHTHVYWTTAAKRWIEQYTK